MHVNYQASSFTCVGGEWRDVQMRDVTPHPYTKFLNSPLASHQSFKKVSKLGQDKVSIFDHLKLCKITEMATCLYIWWSIKDPWVYTIV